MNEIVQHYQLHYREDERLGKDAGPLEFARTKELLLRALPPPPAVVLDFGGGPGAYAAWLTGLGYTVHLADLVPRHAQQARSVAASSVLADARAMPYRGASAGAVLLLGPLYHLTERSTRIDALREARRTLRPGGALFAAAISRFASLLDGLFTGAIDDPEFRAIVGRDLEHGEHRSHRPDYFTTAFFHHPDELAGEVVEAGFKLESLLAVEGPFWAAPDFGARWADPARRAVLLEFARKVESEPSLMGMSLHLLATATPSSQTL